MFAKLESLETRRLLSSATLADGHLRVRGDDVTNEDIILTMANGATEINVTIEGQDMGNFAVADVTKVTVNGKSGNDDLILDESGGRFRGFLVRLYGGDGRDVIRGGRDKVQIYGEGGNDNLTGRGYINGGDGHDTITGSAGKDYILAGAGHDFVDAEEGNDVVFGDAGNDRLEGDEGRDIVFGGDDNDTITGGQGDDQLFGNAGIDHLHGEDGDDTLWGGRNEDVLEGGDGGADVKNFGEFADIEALMTKHLNAAKKYVV